MNAAAVVQEIPKPLRFLLRRFGVPVDALGQVLEAIPPGYLRAVGEVGQIIGGAAEFGPQGPPEFYWRVFERGAPAVGLSAELLAALAAVWRESAELEEWDGAVRHALTAAGPQLANRVGSLPDALLEYATAEYGNGRVAGGRILAAAVYMLAQRRPELDPEVVEELGGLLVT